MKRVFSSIPLLFLFIGLSILFFELSVLLPSLSLLTAIGSQSGSFSEVIGILLPFAHGSVLELNASTILFSLIFSILISLNIVLTIFFIRTSRFPYSKSNASGTLGGIIAGILGLGCASCGSLLISTLSTSTVGIGIISFFPFHGAEIGYLGLILLTASVFKLAQNINNPHVCSV